MSLLLYKLKRVFRKKSSILIILIITFIFIYQYTTLPELTQGQLSHLQESIHNNLDASKDQQSNTNQDSTIPFYKSKAAQKIVSSSSLLSTSSFSSKEGDSKNNDNNKENYQDVINKDTKSSKLRDQIRQLSLNLENDKTHSRLALGHDLFKNIFNSLQKSQPKIPKLQNYKTDQRIYHAGYDGESEHVFTEEYLNSFLDLTDEEVTSLKESHDLIVNELPTNLPNKFYSGDGIVYVGGGKFNWLALLSIKSLRSLDSKLPVEVLIPTEEEYDIKLCTKIFPALNAKCILLSHVLGDEVMSKFSFKGYQYKALALITSSFENVLLLDSDNIPVHAPDYLFTNEPFLSSGLITWPDFWRRATSPNYYKIAGIEVHEERVRFGHDDRDRDSKEVSFHDRLGAIPDPTSESGQLMISKSSHTKELFLALYYNLYGPDYYYPLFSQGSDGEGDKETFLAATVALNGSYYQVQKFLNAFGHFNIDREFIGTGMGQYDPVEDYNIQLAKKRQKDISKDLNQELFDINKSPRILFVHANFPKLNPVTLREEGKIFERTGERLRLYGPGMAKRIGYDFELIQWRSMHFLVCELNIEVESFNGQSHQEVCKEILDQLEHLENTAKDNERD